MYALDRQTLFLFFTKALDMALAAQQHALALELYARHRIIDQERQDQCVARAYGSFDAWYGIEGSIAKAWDAWEEDATRSEVKQRLLTELHWNMGMTAATLALSHAQVQVHRTSLATQQAFYRYIIHHWPL
ncbi:hypothetical protein [Ktedonobacter robiniae]|uniref:Uncharacterized protein n=1 Tax=Ktedonobacter robiniae TaxID=2778365 RepID=A0ABQ3V353_9CHLR|nr:hypothetical protein [Ktedonobacter robiniae]GHO59192.1 hypothetical protein KSB_76670 [Ktedonobacter robiniae]